MAYKLPQNHRPTMKIILVGSSGVGKTCLISSYLKQTFDENKTSTVAPSYSFIDVKNSKGLSVRLQIWDTAGQERYHSVSQLFFRDSDIAFVCFDAGDKESVSAVPDWVKRVKDEVQDCELFFVITKRDLYDDEKIKEAEIDAKAMLDKFEPKGYFITSAKNNLGVNELFNAAVEIYKPKNSSSKPSIAEVKENEKKGGCC